MPVSPYALQNAFVYYSTSQVCTAYQDPGRARAFVSSNSTDVFTMTPANAFPIVAGTAVSFSSANLPSIFVGRDVIYVSPGPAADQFYCYYTVEDAIAGANKVTSATSWSGTVLDLDLDRQFVRSVLLAYESTFTGYARKNHSFAAGSSVTGNQLVRTASLSLNNTGTTAAQISHVFAITSSETIGVARLASVTTIPAGQTLPVTAQLSALSVGTV